MSSWFDILAVLFSFIAAHLTRRPVCSDQLADDLTCGFQGVDGIITANPRCVFKAIRYFTPRVCLHFSVGQIMRCIQVQLVIHFTRPTSEVIGFRIEERLLKNFLPFRDWRIAGRNLR